MHKTRMIKWFIFLSLTILSFSAQAKQFKNAYISFDILENWDCKIEQTEWICRATDEKESREAVIILTAKEKGPTDTLPLYRNYMDNPINTPSKTGGSLTSRVIYKATDVKYNDQIWLDGLHQDSEVRNYFTRYLASIKENIAILVTFSAHKDFYSKHSKHFNDTIKSIRIIATKNPTTDKGIERPGGDGGFLGTNNQGGPGMAIDGSDAGNKKGLNGLFDNELLLGLGALILAAIAYVIFKILKNR